MHEMLKLQIKTVRMFPNERNGCLDFSIAALRRCVISKQVAVQDPSITLLISTRQRRLKSGETPPPCLPPPSLHRTERKLHFRCFLQKNNLFGSSKQGILLTPSVEVLRSGLQLRVVAAWPSRRSPARQSAGGKGGWVGRRRAYVCLFGGPMPEVTAGQKRRDMSLQRAAHKRMI